MIRAVGDTISRDDLRGAMEAAPGGEANREIQRQLPDIPEIEDMHNLMGLHTFKDSMEKAYIEEVLRYTNRNQTEAARILRVNYSTLHRRMKKLQIDPNAV